jgi:hypothetical protein
MPVLFRRDPGGRLGVSNGALQHVSLVPRCGFFRRRFGRGRDIAHVGRYVFDRRFFDAFDDVHLNTAGAIGDLGDQVGAFHAPRLNRLGVIRDFVFRRLPSDAKSCSFAARRKIISVRSTSQIRTKNRRRRSFNCSAPMKSQPLQPHFRHEVGDGAGILVHPVDTLLSPATLRGRGDDLVLKIAHANHQNEFIPRKNRCGSMNMAKTGQMGQSLGAPSGSNNLFTQSIARIQSFLLI